LCFEILDVFFVDNIVDCNLNDIVLHERVPVGMIHSKRLLEISHSTFGASFSFLASSETA